MYKSSAKFRQRIKEHHTLDVGAGLTRGVNKPRSNKSIKKKILKNLQKNLERLQKCKDALARQDRNRIKLEGKIQSADNEDFRTQHKIWLDLCKLKITDISASIKKIETWIAVDRRKLESLDRY
jgi:hypothetical protein